MYVSLLRALYDLEESVQYSHCLLGKNEMKAQREEGLDQDNRENDYEELNPGSPLQPFFTRCVLCGTQQVRSGDHHSLDRQPGKPQPSGLCPSMSPASADGRATCRKVGCHHLHRDLMRGL